MDGDGGGDFRARLRDVCLIEAESQDSATYFNDMRASVRRIAEALDDEEEAGASLHRAATYLHDGWQKYLRLHHGTESVAEQPSPTDRVAESETFLADVASLVADQLLPLTHSPQPWEVKQTPAHVPPPAVFTSPPPIECDEHTDGANTNGWSPAAVAACVPSSSDAAAFVWLPATLHRRWCAAWHIMDLLASLTASDSPSTHTDSLSHQISNDLLLCMLHEVQKHPSAVSAYIYHRDDHEPPSLTLTDVRLAWLRWHTVLWLLHQCRDEEKNGSTVRAVVVKECAATLFEALDSAAEKGTELCTRCLAPATPGSHTNPRPLEDLQSLVSDVKASLAVPAAILSTAQTASGAHLSLWERVAPSWLSQLLLPVAQRFLAAQGPLARLWEADEARARMPSQTAEGSLRSQMQRVLQTLDAVVGDAVSSQVVPFGALNDALACTREEA